MLISAQRLIGTPVLSVQAGGQISRVAALIVDPNTLKITAFRLHGGVIAAKGANLLPATSVREYSTYGLVIDDIDELAGPNDIVRLAKILQLNFNLVGLKVETKKGSRLGKIIDYTIDAAGFAVQQIIVKRPIVKSWLDPELTIHRKEIVEVTDYKVIIKDEERTLKEKAAKEEFVPNFVNPFRNPESGFAPADRKTPDGKDTA